MQKALDIKVVAAEERRLALESQEPIPLPFRITAVLAFVYMLIPVVIVVLAALNSGNYLTFPPSGLSLRWIVHFLTTESFRSAYLLSLGLASITAIVSTLLGTMTAIALSRYDFPGRSFFKAFLISPLLLPGMVLGLALFTFYVSMRIGLARTLPGLMLGHVLVTLPYVVGTVSAAFYNFDLSLEDAARSLGASPWYAFFKVTLPVVQPGIMAGGIFAFIVSFGQFDVSLFLSTPNLTPLPIAMYDSLRYRFEPTAAAAGTFAILLVIVSTFVMGRLTNIGKFAGLRF